MRSNLYSGITNIVQVIGSIYKNPAILDNEKYSFNEEDFFDEFHQVVYGTLSSLYDKGVRKFTLQEVEDYLANREKFLAIYKAGNGADFILKAAESANGQAFDYYYSRMKKMSLFRAYENLGMDLTYLYNPNDVFNLKKKQEQEEWVDNHSLTEIFEKINERIDVIKSKFVDSSDDQTSSIGEGIESLIESYKDKPAVGTPLYDRFTTTVTRGALNGKFYLRSAATNIGKSRTIIGDACFIGCNQYYSLTEKKWKSSGVAQDTLFIATEQNLQEVQVSAVAFISGVQEDHILMYEYQPGEYERVTKAMEVLKQSKVHFICLPDFSLYDIENVIKSTVRDFDVKFVFFDYIHSSAKILTEVGGKSGVKNLREDNILFLMSSKLKDLAMQLDIFVLSSTQLNGQYQDSDTPDQNLLRGSKAIADRIDWGSIMLAVTQEDKGKLASVCQSSGLPMPNVKMSVYKNRANRWKGIYLWMNADTGICRYETLFATDWSFNIVDIPLLNIIVEEPLSAF